jgi:hypothetical protein
MKTMKTKQLTDSEKLSALKSLLDATVRATYSQKATHAKTVDRRTAEVAAILLGREATEEELKLITY